MTTGPMLVLRQTELHECWRIEVCIQGVARQGVRQFKEESRHKSLFTMGARTDYQVVVGWIAGINFGTCATRSSRSVAFSRSMAKQSK